MLLKITDLISINTLKNFFNMEALFFLKIKTNLQLTALKILNSRKELEVKHPDKKTFIKSMKESE